MAAQLAEVALLPAVQLEQDGDVRAYVTAELQRLSRQVQQVAVTEGSHTSRPRSVWRDYVPADALIVLRNVHWRTCREDLSRVPLVVRRAQALPCDRLVLVVVTSPLWGVFVGAFAWFFGKAIWQATR